MPTMLKLLVVAGEEAIANRIVCELQRAGYEPRCQRVASDAGYRAALNAAASVPDMVLADFVLLRAISQAFPQLISSATPDIPLVLLCDAADEDAAAERLQHGAADYLCYDRLARLASAVGRALDLKRLRDSEAMHRLLVENINEVIYAVDPSGVITYMSPSVQKYTGYSQDELMGMGFVPLIYPEDLVAVLTNFGQSLSGMTEALEYRVVDKAGALHWVRSDAQPIWRDGAVVGVQGALTDVTARKLAEEALARERNLLRTLIDLLPEQIYVKDSQCRYLISNPAVVRKAGAQSEADMLGKTDFDFHPPELAERYFADEQAILQSGRPLLNWEEPIVDPATGSIHWNLTSKVPLRDSAGAVIGLAGVNHDITHRKRAEQELQRRADEFAALYESARTLATEHDLQALLQATLAQAATLLNAPGGSIYLYDPASGDLVLTVTSDSGTRTGLRLKLGEGMAGRVAQTHAPLIVDDYLTWALRSQQFPLTKFGPIVQVPMLFAGELIGVLSVGDLAGSKRKFNEADARLLMLLAGQAASAANGARLLEETRHRADQLQTVNDVARATATILEPDILLSHISQVIRTRLELYSVVIGLTEGDELVFNAGSRADARGSDTPYMRLKIGREGITGRVAAEGQTVLVPDVSLDPRFVTSDYLPNTRSELAVPLKTQSGIIGVLNMESDVVNAFTPELVSLVGTLASQIASAIESARLFAETRRLARTDPLTGIPNRRYLFEMGERELSRARRFGHPLSALMLDIDHFKHVNDTHGHAQGDRVLQALSQCCQQQIRDIDMLGRYGGEEFVIFLIETDLDGARRLAERIRESVAGLVIPGAKDPIRITSSVGIAQLAERNEDLDRLLGRADRALYAAKQAGRNRVEAA